jgi:hypothetical protein
MLADILSITAIILGGASLGWQVLTWRQSGPVVVVTATQAFPTYGHGASSSIGDPHVDVSAQNKGRSPVTVKNWGLKLADGRNMAILEPASWSAKLPYRLEPGDSASWYADTESVKRSCAANGIRYQDLIAYVSLGDGRTVQAKHSGIGWK